MTARATTLALVSIVALAGCASAGLEYEAPTGYAPEVPVTVAYVPVDDLPGACGLTPERLVGCSRLWPGVKCEILIADGLDARLTSEVLAHEQAHCGSWTHEDH